VSVKSFGIVLDQFTHIESSKFPAMFVSSTLTDADLCAYL